MSSSPPRFSICDCAFNIDKKKKKLGGTTFAIKSQLSKIAVGKTQHEQAPLSILTSNKAAKARALAHLRLYMTQYERGHRQTWDERRKGSYACERTKRKKEGRKNNKSVKLEEPNSAAAHPRFWRLNVFVSLTSLFLSLSPFLSSSPLSPLSCLSLLSLSSQSLLVCTTHSFSCCSQLFPCAPLLASFPFSFFFSLRKRFRSSKLTTLSFSLLFFYLIGCTFTHSG